MRAALDPRIQIAFFKGLRPEIASIRRVIRELNIDLVQVAGVQNFHGAFAAKQEKIPLVWQLLSTYAPSLVRRILSPMVARLADVIMVTGRGTLLGHPGLQDLKDRVVIFFPPVDTREFYPDLHHRLVARAEMGVPGDVLLIGTVGNFNRQKRHDILVKAAYLLIRQFPNLYVRILGSPTVSHSKYYERNVKALAEKLGLLKDERLKFISPGSRVAHLLPAFDVFVLTSMAEGVPTVVLEAMACGLPVVATNVGSVADVVRDGKTGFLVPPFRPNAVAEAVGRLLTSPELRLGMGKEARKLAEQLYDTERCADVHAQAYEMALKNFSKG
jgi:glycosyltransferase involved in cell wall biosynthesis